MEMMLEVAMGVMDMEDDKVDDMVLKIPNYDFTDVTVAIGDTYGDDVRGNDVGAEHGGSVDKVAKFLTNASGATWWPNF